MTTELWFRNPHTYINELVECGQFRIAWDRGFLIKRKIDPIKHASLYFGNTYDWRALAIGVQGSAEYREGDEWDKPSAVYPTWTYGEEWGTLLDMIENPAGQDINACTDKAVDGNERPVFGQEHRIIITELPSANLGPTRKFLAELKVLQEDYPDAVIHLHGSYSYRVAFGLGFRAADIEPRTLAQKGRVTLPSGKNETFERVAVHSKWVTNLGFRPVDLAVPRNRCMYNIKSAVWAADNFASLFNFRVSPSRALDIVSPDSMFQPQTTPQTLSPGAKAKTTENDKIQCDFCSLQNDCKFYRTGAVCSLPDAEPRRLASYFNTRDSETIIDGLGTLMAAGAERLQEGRRMESILGDLDPEVTKQLNQLFGQGVQLAKLIDPKLRGGTKVNIGVGGNAAVQINGTNPNTLIAGIVRELENQGVKREDISPEMIEGVLRGMSEGTKKQQAIEGTVITEESA